MTAQTVIFYAFAAILVFAALRVITSRNPVHSALWLVLSFFSSAGVWMLLRAEFLAIALVLVYVGAVMVLFFFVVRSAEHTSELHSFLPDALPICAVFFQLRRRVDAFARGVPGHCAGAGLRRRGDGAVFVRGEIGRAHV